MSDRLKELQRQRALVQEHLAWLDREIARESQAGTTPSVPSVGAGIRSSSPAPAGLAAPAAAKAEVEAEALMAEYRRDPETVQSSVKKGCFIYFFAAFGLLGLGLAAWYFLRSGR